MGLLAVLDWVMTTAPGWKDRVRQACERFIEDVELTLPPQANFADLELAVGKFSPEMLRETLQALVDAEDFSPTRRRDT